MLQSSALVPFLVAGAGVGAGVCEQGGDGLGLLRGADAAGPGRPEKAGIITARGRELLAALTPAQRASRAARELRGLVEDNGGSREIPA